jgi:N-acetylglucosaminylphosphatidylinositol deacetylase
MSNKYNSINDYLSYLDYIQDNLKYILSFIIIMNFIIIFLLKFSIRAKQKIQTFFDNPTNQKEIKEILLIIAHPDDEIMFFYPSLKNFIKNNLKIRILCLSNGNFIGLGKIREGEFSQVMKKLKIEDFVILDDEKLKDDMKLKWNETYVSEKIKNYFLVEDGNGRNFEKIGTILTFDDAGVTKHPNHSSCCDGLM